MTITIKAFWRLGIVHRDRLFDIHRFFYEHIFPLMCCELGNLVYPIEECSARLVSIVGGVFSAEIILETLGLENGVAFLGRLSCVDVSRLGKIDLGSFFRLNLTFERTIP